MTKIKTYKNEQVEHLILGAGLSGLVLALKLSKLGHVLVLTKGKAFESNSYYAQGGIASVLGEDDTFEDHIRDTLVAGAGLCQEDIVRLVVEDGPRAIEELINLGVPFTKESNADGGGYHLTREGGHSKRRVIHADDFTGKAVITALHKAVRKNKNIEVREGQTVIDLITSDKVSKSFSKNRCLGGYILDRESGGIYTIKSPYTYLCTGGHGKTYLYTSNPDSATGDGLAVGWRAGCRVVNLEFMQFHPTCLYSPEAKTFLISEAVRGEGGILKTHEGKEFMQDYHPMKSLAPRDIVARAIDSELKKSGENFVHLDVRHLGKTKIEKLFPHINKTCLQYGLDMSKEMIPVVPAAHYSCGGLAVNEKGETDVDGLFALGEVACTGLHGANRLASNSLLEGLVFADKVFHSVENKTLSLTDIEIPSWKSGDSISSDEQVVLSHNWDEIRRLMWNYVGVVRTDKRLKRALSRITAIRSELNTYYWNYKITNEFLEVRNLSQVAWLTIRSALKRKESRGIHYTLDYKEALDNAYNTILK